MTTQIHSHTLYKLYQFADISLLIYIYRERERERSTRSDLVCSGSISPVIMCVCLSIPLLNRLTFLQRSVCDTTHMHSAITNAQRHRVTDRLKHRHSLGSVIPRRSINSFNVWIQSFRNVHGRLHACRTAWPQYYKRVATLLSHKKKLLAVPAGDKKSDWDSKCSLSNCNFNPGVCLWQRFLIMHPHISHQKVLLLRKSEFFLVVVLLSGWTVCV